MNPLISLTNKICKPPVHPFNLQKDGVKTYAEWQYERGADTVRFFTARYPVPELFAGKYVLDMGCGAAGKSLSFLTMGADRVVGVDIVPAYEEEAMALAARLGLDGRFRFLCADASRLPFPDSTFDTIIMNDFMEHTADPEATLREALRLVRPGGKICINFPPYGHPYGAHMSDLIYMPWVHLFLSERTLCRDYRTLAQALPDGDARVRLRITTDENGRDAIGYINKMTLRRFKKLLASLSLTPLYYKEVPLRPFLAPLAALPLLKEVFVKMAVCVLSKDGDIPKESV